MGPPSRRAQPRKGSAQARAPGLKNAVTVARGVSTPPRSAFPRWLWTAVETCGRWPSKSKVPARRRRGPAESGVKATAVLKAWRGSSRDDGLDRDHSTKRGRWKMAGRGAQRFRKGCLAWRPDPDPSWKDRSQVVAVPNASFRLAKHLSRVSGGLALPPFLRAVTWLQSRSPGARASSASQPSRRAGMNA
jgi:hypothetical protein